MLLLHVLEHELLLLGYTCKAIGEPIALETLRYSQKVFQGMTQAHLVLPHVCTGKAL